MAESCDLLVIGAGPGGLAGAQTAAQMGKSVILVDATGIGGACVHTGTIPSKSLQASAIAGLPYPTAVRQMQKSIADSRAATEKTLANLQVRFLAGKAFFKTPTEIEINSGRALTSVHAKKVLIATGSKPIRHAEFPFHLSTVFDSDSFLQLPALPQRILVLGAGVIGCEYASILAKFGADVVLADRRGDLLRFLDPDLIEALKAQMQEQKIQLYLGAKIECLKESNSRVSTLINDKPETFDAILVCMGRNPNTEELLLPQVGVHLDARSHIVVNPKTFQTSQESIFAVGDVIGPPGLAATALEQGRFVVNQLFGASTGAFGFPTIFPSGIYTIAELASVGKTEWELKSQQTPYVVGKAAVDATARGIIQSQKTGFLKLLIEKSSGKILGVHIHAPQASELIHLGQTFLQTGLTAAQVADTIYNYPTYAELYRVAAQQALLNNL